jgi:hypothetical protein
MNKPIHPTTVTGEVLLFLAHQDGKWATWGSAFYMPTVQSVFPVGTTEATQLRFMQNLQRKRLVGGCDCGCRGDYVPTRAGLRHLANECHNGEIEVARWLRNGLLRGWVTDILDTDDT